MTSFLGQGTTFDTRCLACKWLSWQSSVEPGCVSQRFQSAVGSQCQEYLLRGLHHMRGNTMITAGLALSLILFASDI